MSIVLFFVKQKTAYELRISDWSSDVCSSDLFSLVDNFTPVTSVPKGFYLTDAISDHAVDQVRQLGKGKKPFMMYLAYTAAHWPLMAPEETIQKYIPRFSKGWDALRKERYKKQIELGLKIGRAHV